LQANCLLIRTLHYASKSRIPRLVLVLAALTASAQAQARSDIRVCAGGDVSLGTNLDTSWALARSARGARPLPDPSVLLAPLRPLMGGAQIVLLNVEGAIGEGVVPPKCAPHATLCFAFRQPTSTAEALRHVADSALVVGNVANNHAHDAGDDGFLATLRLLGGAGVLVTGADTLATPVPVGADDTVAVLGFSPWSVANVTDLAAVRRHVARAAAAFGRVIVTMHTGAEGPAARHTYDRTERFAGEDRGNSVAFAHAAMEAGASLVIGHGPHVLRAMEWGGPSGEALTAYSLGNLVTYGPFTHTGFRNHGVILCATLDGSGAIRNAELRSTLQRAPGIVAADARRLGARDISALSRRDFPRTGAIISSDGTVRARPR
jgi:hypothetical protein